MAAKRFTQSVHHHHQFLSEVMSKPASLPKYDFAKLKKQMPEHAAVLDSLQRQYETLQIPLGTIPDKFIKAGFKIFFFLLFLWKLTQYMLEIDNFLKYVDTKVDLLDRKLVDAAEDEKKVKAKYENMPPIEHFHRDHYAQYFPEVHRDVRLPITRFTIGWGSTNTPEHFEELKELFKDYRCRPVPEHMRK
ncbi:unnamed protein product [Gongylonema pulchrum]|uniref:ATP synthase subunit d, mitochondrial n=1 Tax=Gongylonema pulchrum TaxID=637853 RepID=A0A183DWF8_9BILA|nr:unnamed protein product [Gongylonema pulchrum]